MSSNFLEARRRTESAAVVAAKDDDQEIVGMIQVLAAAWNVAQWINSPGLCPPRASDGPQKWNVTTTIGAPLNIHERANLSFKMHPLRQKRRKTGVSSHGGR